MMTASNSIDKDSPEVNDSGELNAQASNGGEIISDQRSMTGQYLKEQTEEENASSSVRNLTSRVDLLINFAQDTRVHIVLDALPDSTREDEPGETQQGNISQGHSYTIHLPLESSQRITLDLPSSGAVEKLVEKRRFFKPVLDRLRSWGAAWPYPLAETFFGASLFLYLLSRLVGLSNFPIYFFSDEAVQTILAVDFLRENLHNADGEFLPTYFHNVDKYSLSTTVYLQVLPYLLFGKSVFITRVTSVLISMLAAICVGLILRDIFKMPYWWSGGLLLSITPAWFLHSRTAFETVTMVSFYTVGIYFYLRYRYDTPRLLYAALTFLALAFYSYNPGQIVVILTGLLLLISDIRYHWKQRQVAFRGLGLLVLLALPYLRFYLAHPDSAVDHLSTLGSYWLQTIPLREKLALYKDEYLFGLSPGYWFIPNQRDLIRHVMKDYGNLLRASLPFALLGMFQALRSFRSPAYRALLIAFLVAPAGAAIAQIAVTRALVMVIPAALFAALGIDLLFSWIEKKVSRRVLSIALFGLLAAMNIYIAWDALWNGPIWYSNYGLSGLQYGAEQVYGATKEFLRENREDRLFVSPSWANGADIVARYFLDDPLPVQLSSIQGHIDHLLPLDDHMVFVLPEDEYRAVLESGKFTGIQIERIVPYPDGRPGFYFIRLRYVEDVEKIMEAEQALRRELIQTEAQIAGQSVFVRHSLLDLGRIVDLWDGNPRTVTRTFEANPYIIEITFASPIQMESISMIIGDTEVRVLARVQTTDGTQPILFQEQLLGSVSNPSVTLEFDDVLSVENLHLEISDMHQGEPGHVHIWEIYFR